MADSALHCAQQGRQRRANELLDERAEFVLDRVGLSEDRCLQLAVSPDARKKLKGILAKYAKSPHPFRACMRDNEARFGKDRAERICAKLKDMIVGTTKWRKGVGKMHAADVILDCPVLDDDVVVLLDEVDTTKLAELLSEGDR